MLPFEADVPGSYGEGYSTWLISSGYMRRRHGVLISGIFAPTLSMDLSANGGLLIKVGNPIMFQSFALMHFCGQFGNR